MLIQSSPYGNNGTSRFNNNSNSNSSNNMMGLMRSPSNTISSNPINLRHQIQQQQQMHSDVCVHLFTLNFF